MTTKQTEAHDDTPAAEPLALSLHDLLGPLPEAATTGTFPGPHGYSREQMRAYAAHELESLQDSYGQLMADNVRLRAELAEAVTALPQAVRNERERCAKLCEELRDKHIDGTRLDTNPGNWCAEDGADCAFVCAWNDAAASIRRA